MPLHEYQCEACGHRFEKIQKFSDAPIEACPKCGGHVRKLISSPAFQFKGSGWYVTDYAKQDSSAERKADSAPKEESAAPKEKEGAAKTESPSSTSSSSSSETASTTKPKAESPKTKD